ncbi:ArsR family transcriptional regulator [Paenibacillus sophorae]|uniref:ArsR family transcriptional regulator n=1 Tax=Paenibacillus sophorae TaxID=1333845 RepID=A0A1H8SUI3_9BACL|nr:metalloregulator ArsR/SmtB family transcription factor [Paenibacillus sophorae]QWU15568.1 metalloregulator ArsR/SmtB family transcription factor [Paenibacillus sophorae]SEO82331.1 ArsR family transcriptional regulator [Paenibacillus sophorae]
MFNVDMADKLKLLGDRTRLTILGLLKDKEWCVCDLVGILNMSQPGVSQHLRKLKAQGIVNETRRRQWVYYSLNVEDKPSYASLLRFSRRVSRQSASICGS